MMSAKPVDGGWNEETADEVSDRKVVSQVMEESKIDTTACWTIGVYS